MSIDNMGGLLIVLLCLGAVFFGKDNATTNAVMFTVIGRMYGKYQRKARE